MGAAASISAPEEKKTLLAKCVEEYEAEAAKDGAQTDAILDILADKYTDIIQHVDESKWPEFSAWLAKDRQLCMPCEAIGSVPRPQAVVDALNGGETNFDSFLPHVQETVSKLLQATDNDVNVPVTDGEQTKPSFFTYPIHGMANLNPNGVQIPFVDGHVRTLPSITSGPFQYTKYAVDYLRELKKHVPPGQKVKQAVIAASGVSMLYPTDPIADYPKEQFMQDVVQEVVKDIKQCLDEGADVVQMDMTEARLSLKMDPSGGLLQMLLNVNEMVISQFSDEEKQKIGIHVCPGADHNTTHSADVDYDMLIPPLLGTLTCGRFYLQFKSEPDPHHVLEVIKANLKPHQRIFIGCIDPNNARVETPDDVAHVLLDAAMYIPVEQLGACDDCGLSPFADDVAMSRDIAFAKIRARIDGTRKASRALRKQQT